MTNVIVPDAVILKAVRLIETDNNEAGWDGDDDWVELSEGWWMNVWENPDTLRTTGTIYCCNDGSIDCSVWYRINLVINDEF